MLNQGNGIAGTGAPGQADDDLAALLDSDWLELVSLGVDIGTSTTHFVFSRLRLARMGHQLSARYVVVSREILWRSPVHWTPYEPDRERIDADALQQLLRAAHEHAGLPPDAVDTGAVVATGEAARRENARKVVELFASEGGKFVCATAGHHLEARLAAYGSGAVALSREQGGRRVLNIDVGGGTTKYSVVEAGTVTSTTAIHLGGRLLRLSEDLELTAAEDAGAEILRLAGVDWSPGERKPEDEVADLARWMAATIVRYPFDAAFREEVEGSLLLTEPPDMAEGYDAVVFSGGVSECMAGTEARFLGDMGSFLGEALVEAVEASALPVVPARAGILATVVGASQHTVQVSGDTIYLSQEDGPPLRNVRVVRTDVVPEADIDPAAVGARIQQKVDAVLEDNVDDDVAVALHWKGTPSFSRISRLAQAIEIGLGRRIEEGRLLCLVFDGDVGRSVGAYLDNERRIDNRIVVVDGIEVSDFEFIDIGRTLQDSGAVPVTIKSLVF